MVSLQEELHLEVQEKAMRGRGHPALLGSGSNNPDGKKDMVPKLVLHEAWGQVSGPGPVPVPGSNPGSDAEAGPRSTGISTSDLRPLRRLTPIVRPKPKPITKPAPMTGESMLLCVVCVNVIHQHAQKCDFSDFMNA